MLEKKIGMKPKKIRADFALTSTSFDGIDLIREALLTAKHTVNVNDWHIEFKMIAPPNYKVELSTMKRQEGVKKLEEAMDIVQKIMKANKQKFQLKMAPRVIGNQQEPDVADLLEEQKRREFEYGKENESDIDEDHGDMVDSDDEEMVVDDDSDNEEAEQKKEPASE